MTISTSVSALFEHAAQEGRGVLLEHEAYALVSEAGIATPAHFFVPAGDRVDATALADLRPGDVVVKLVSPDILHKSDVGGVRRVERLVGAIDEAAAAMIERARRQVPDAELCGVLVVEAVDVAANVPGVEYLLSVRRDPSFGPVIVFAFGGVLAEWYGHLSGRTTRVLLPVDGLDVDRAVGTIADSPLGELALRPGRLHERPPLDAASLARCLTAMVDLIDMEAGIGRRIDEVEINPLAAVDGRPVALDALVKLGAPAPAPRPARPIAKLRQLLHPKSAAVIGASGRSRNAGRIILENLKRAEGLEYGRLYAVHPLAETVDGVRAYPSVSDLPEPVDLAVVSLPAHAAGDAVADLVTSRKTESIILIPGGFAETGQVDRSMQIEQSLSLAHLEPDGGPVMVGGNCLGIVSKGEYNTFFLPSYKLPFHDAPGDNLVAVGQSGAYLVSFTSNLDGIVFPRASISYGNEMDLTAADFLEYYLDHEPEVRVFSFYIEGFPAGEGERFARLVRRATSSGRAVVVYKAGRTEHGARAAASHTASMTGDYEVASEILRASGAMVADTLNMFEDYTKIFAMLGDFEVHGRRVGVITNAGFEAGAVSDHLYTLELADFSAATNECLSATLPPIAHVGNPVDTTPMADTARFMAAVETVAADPCVDMVIVSAIPAAPALDVLAPDLAGEHSENIFALGSLPAELIRVRQSITKPMVVTVDSGRLYDPTVLYLERRGIPVYRKIDRASRALSTFASQHLDMAHEAGQDHAER